MNKDMTENKKPSHIVPVIEDLGRMGTIVGYNANPNYKPDDERQDLTDLKAKLNELGKETT